MFSRGVCRIIVGLMSVLSGRFWMRLLPKPFGDLERIDLEVLPPGHLIADLMQLPMMSAAERDGELIADFHAHGSGLSEPQMMWVGWLPSADQAGLRGYELQMGFVAQPFRLSDRQQALVDPRR